MDSAAIIEKSSGYLFEENDIARAFHGKLAPLISKIEELVGKKEATMISKTYHSYINLQHWVRAENVLAHNSKIASRFCFEVIKQCILCIIMCTLV